MAKKLTYEELEDRIRRLADNSPDLIYRMLLSDGRYEYVNPAVTAVTGYTPEEWYKGAVAMKDIIHPESYADFKNEWDKMINGRPSLTFQCRIIHKDGSDRWVNQRNFAVKDATGKIVAIEGIVTDITELKKSQKLLDQNEKKLRALVDNSLKPVLDEDGNVIYLVPEGRDIKDLKEIINKLEQNEKKLMALLDNSFQLTGLLDAEGRLLMANKTAVDFAGVTEGELLGRYFWETKWWTYSPESQAFCKDAVQRAMKGQSIMLEMPIMSSAGNIKMIDFSLKPVFDEDENVIYMVPEGRDITEKIETDKVLRREEKKYRTILQTAVDGYWLTDLRGRILEVNDAYCRMSGYSEKELLSMHIPELEREKNPHGITSTIDEVLRQNQGRFETKHRGKDGTLYDVEVSYKYLAIEDGRSVFFLRDITKHKAAEKETKSLQAQLLHAQKMEAIGRLAGGVAHDFNNMLSVILGYGEMVLEKTEPGQEFHSALQEIMTAARRSADITRQLLAFARRQTIQPKMIDLNNIVSGMVKMIQRLIGEDIQLTWLPGKELWPVHMDPSQIDQILVNLCVNARDAIHGVGRLTIETGNISIDEDCCRNNPGFLPGDFVSLAVSDSGMGMDTDTLRNVFEPFFTTKGVDKGTGLGLATIYGIVKQNNGFINVYSEPNMGATFRIYLPRYRIAGDLEIEAAVARPEQRGDETILLVEDEASILHMVGKLLESLGYKVLAVEKPHRAIEIAREYNGHIHLLMTDVVMPGMNGRELSHHILSEYPDIKLLFVSGYTADVIVHHGVLDEGVNCIQKPFSKRDISVKVREVLNSSE